MDPDFEWRTRDEKLLVVAYWWTEQSAMCCICGEKMEPYHRGATTNPLRATIEHLKPRRDGGANTVANVRLAHALCNHALGAQWERNQHLIDRGLEPISDKHAIAAAWSNYRANKSQKLTALDRAKEVTASKVAAKEKKKLPGVSWNAGNALSLPRGATLLPDVQKKLGIEPKNRIVKPRMTAAETARWLAERGVRGA